MASFSLTQRAGIQPWEGMLRGLPGMWPLMEAGGGASALATSPEGLVTYSASSFLFTNLLRTKPGEGSLPLAEIQSFRLLFFSRKKQSTSQLTVTESSDARVPGMLLGL